MLSGWRLLTMLAVLGVASAAGAQTHRAEACDAAARRGSPPRVVDATLPASQADELEVALGGLLSRLDVRLCTRRVDLVDGQEALGRPADAARALAHVWVVYGATRATVSVVDSTFTNVLVRRVPLEDLMDEVAREEIAQIVHAAAETLLAGAPIGVRREDLATIRPAAPRSAPPLIVSPRLGWAFRLHGGGVPPAHELSAGVDLRIGRGPLTPRLGLAVGGRLPGEARDQRVRMTMSGVRVIAEGGIHLAPSDSTGLFATVGAGLDLTFLSVDQVPGSVVIPAPSRSLVLPIVTGSVGLQQRIAGGLVVAAGASIDLDVTDARFVIDAGADRPTVADPWRLRPALWTAVAVELEP